MLKLVCLLNSTRNWTEKIVFHSLLNSSERASKKEENDRRKSQKILVLCVISSKIYLLFVKIIIWFLLFFANRRLHTFNPSRACLSLLHNFCYISIRQFDYICNLFPTFFFLSLLLFFLLLLLVCGWRGNTRLIASFMSITGTTSFTHSLLSSPLTFIS